MGARSVVPKLSIKNLTPAADNCGTTGLALMKPVALRSGSFGPRPESCYPLDTSLLMGGTYGVRGTRAA
jgi:hypothetical protein